MMLKAKGCRCLAIASRVKDDKDDKEEVFMLRHCEPCQEDAEHPDCTWQPAYGRFIELTDEQAAYEWKQFAELLNDGVRYRTLSRCFHDMLVPSE